MELPSPQPVAPPASRPLDSAAGRQRLRVGLHGLRVTAVLFGLYALLFHVSVVRGNSMAPSIHDGDRILVAPWSLYLSQVERGDVVVLRYPLDPRLDYIKRVVGLPGDEVLLAGGRLWVNGTEVLEPYVEEQDPESFVRTRVQAGHYFVLGDNRRRSSDSREFGQVPADHLRGVVDLRLWPISRVGPID